MNFSCDLKRIFINLFITAEWHYSCYNVSWAERQAARLIFGTLPEPDLEEALTCLKKAEELGNHLF